MTATTGVAVRGRRPFGQARQTPLVIVLSIVAFFSVLPFLWAFITSLKTFKDAFTFPPRWTFVPSAESFVFLWQNTTFLAVTINTVVVALATVVLSLAISAPAAYALARFRGSIGPWILITALIFRALPRFAFALPFYNLARAVGLYDTKTVLIIALVALNQPFSLWLLHNFFREVPEELDEAAMIDGCTRLSTFRRVIVPLAVPGLFTAGIFTFLLAYQEYLVVIALTQTKAQTLSVFVASFSSAQDFTQYQAIAACGTILTVPAILIAMLAQRYLVAGLTTGAVKS